MKCKKCGSENLGVMFDVIVSAPIKYYYNFSKQAMRDKGVRLWGADWHKADIVCGDCYYSTALNKNAATNADRIRGMTDEELAEIIAAEPTAEKIPFCKNKPECDAMLDADLEIPESMCAACVLDWLKRPAETEGTE